MVIVLWLLLLVVVVVVEVLGPMCVSVLLKLTLCPGELIMLLTVPPMPPFDGNSEFIGLNVRKMFWLAFLILAECASIGLASMSRRSW